MTTLRNKYLWLATLVLGAIAWIMTGCTTLGLDNGQSLRRVTTAAKVAANTGTFLYLQKHPETRPAFVLARDQLQVIESSEHVDMALLLSIVQRLPVKDLSDPAAQLLISNATIILTDFAGNLPVDKLDNLKPVAQAIREGIDLGLGTGFSAVPPPSNAPLPLFVTNSVIKFVSDSGGITNIPPLIKTP